MRIFSILLGILSVSVLGYMLAGKGMNRVGAGIIRSMIKKKIINATSSFK